MVCQFYLSFKRTSFLLCWFLLKIWNASRICMLSLRRGHANLLCIIPILVYVLPKRAPICLFLLLFLLPWETDLREDWYDLCQRMFCLYSLLEVFTVSCLVLKSLSHFEFIFVYSVRMCSNFIDLHAAVQLPKHHLLKRLSFSHCIFLSILSKINWP